jgi:hypothetical protein
MTFRFMFLGEEKACNPRDWQSAGVKKVFLPFRERGFTVVAFIILIIVDLKLRLSGFVGIYKTVKRWRPISLLRKPTPDLIRIVCAAVDQAALYYFREIRCLEKSAVVVLMLRALGVPAELVIGCRKIPFASHAWVEVNRSVVNDNKDVGVVYAVLDRV